MVSISFSLGKKKSQHYIIATLEIMVNIQCDLIISCIIGDHHGVTSKENSYNADSKLVMDVAIPKAARTSRCTCT